MEKLRQALSKQIEKITLIKIAFIVTTFLFALPSIMYIAKHQTIRKFLAVYTYFMELPRKSVPMDRIMNTILFVGLLAILFILYGLMLKYHDKLFKKKRHVWTIIITVSILFMMILPVTSLDVYSYIGHGYLGAHYGENPYYTTIQDVTGKGPTDNEMFEKVAIGWRNETVVYGPLWTSICTGLASLSFGNINIALLIFKLANLLIHLGCCFLIWKLTGKKIWVILYGLNPFILFEFLSNVHNDIFLLFFVLLACYMLIKKKKLGWAVTALACATAIKYFTILLLPIMILYAVRKEKMGKRILSCFLYGIEMLGILALFYLIYLRDFQVFAGLFIQQSKVNTSILYLIYYFTGKNESILSAVQAIAMIGFILYYVSCMVYWLRKKELHWSKMMRSSQMILLVFLFILITNFRPWYISWLFLTIFWQRTGTIRMINYLAFASQIANGYTYLLYLEDEVKVGIPFILTVLLLPPILEIGHKVKIKVLEKRRRLT